MKAKENKCPAEFTLTLIGGRWKIPLIFHLQSGSRRFSRTRARIKRRDAKSIDPATSRDGAYDGLVARKVYAQVPPKVEYSLTDLGFSLRPVVEAMCKWGEAHGAPALARKARA